MWLLLFSIITILFVIYIYIRFLRADNNKKIDTGTTIEVQKTSQEAALPREYYVLVGAKTPMRYYFYPVYIFHSKESLGLYKNIIVKHLMIEEPFHTAFVNILIFLDKNDDCIKSNRTQEFKLKIRNSGEKGNAYLVYSIKELIFETLYSVFDYTNGSYGRRSIQALLLATAFVHMQKMRQWSYFSSEVGSEIEQCISIAKSFMKDESSLRRLVFDMIKKIKENDGEFGFVNRYFESAKRFAKEYPYVQHQDGEQKLLPGSTSIHSKKSLYTIGDFGV
ncbi:MAG: hypothetical protein PHX65_04800 [Sulfurimonas sp.]|nr:hypothetical protein [Sulfurimonas sp.]